MNQDRSSITQATQKEAADWFARLDQNRIENEDLDAFEAWRAAPGNRAAYDRVVDINRAARELRGDPTMSALATEALHRGARRRARRARLAGPAALISIGALAAACLVGGLAIGVAAWRPTYSTGVGQTFTARLEDGSRLQLNTDSQVRVRYSKGERRIELLRGQALFEVAHNAQRPFIVAADGAQVRALGTRFEVRRDGRTVRVVLAQGSVEITDTAAQAARWRLTPGQALTLAPGGDAKARAVPVDVPATTAWTTGSLVFQGVPLGEAVAELNRYSRDKIVLGDGVPAQRQISGVFKAGDQADFVAAAAALYALEPVQRPNGDVELRATSTPNG